MKPCIKSHLPLLIAGLGLMLAGRMTAQTFTVFHSFTAGSGGAYPAGTNSDGVGPNVSTLSGDTLYGTTAYGGINGNGTVFAVNTDGTGFTTLHSFSALSVPLPYAFGTNGDGAWPNAGLILSGNTLYGTAELGGSAGRGTVFAVDTNGTVFTVLHSFMGAASGSGPYTNSDGAYPQAGLILLGNTLYGTTGSGGTWGNGTVFALNTEGTGFTNLHVFTYSDGVSPIAGLILSGNTLYGTTQLGGGSRAGTVFAINTDGTGFTNLHSFTGGYGTNSDGAYPQAGLILLGNSLYGTAYSGGTWGNGTVFAVDTNGTGFTVVHNFTATYYGTNITFQSGTNSDGAGPTSLVLSGNTLYGTATGGGSSDHGTVFALNTDGTGFATLHSFMYTDGDYPKALILSDHTLYGTAGGGGSSGAGTVFSIFIQPQLTIIPSGGTVILAWPTNYPWFTLQSTTNLVSPVWTTNSPPSVVVNGQYRVTNPILGTQKFYRLSQ